MDKVQDLDGAIPTVKMVSRINHQCHMHAHKESAYCIPLQKNVQSSLLKFASKMIDFKALKG